METLKKNRKYILIGLMPALIIYFIFVIIPIFKSFVYGFTDWNGLSELKFIGMKNFKEILTDEYFWVSFRNNIYVVIASVFGQIPIALILATILNKKIKGVNIFRTIYFMPMVLSTVVVAILWSNIYNSQIGILNAFLQKVGLNSWTHNWFGDTKVAMLSVCIVIIWQYVGLYLIIFLAAYQNIPESILEASEIDGASEKQKFFKITLPMLWDTIKVAIVLCIAGSMKSFDLVFVMTGGGPAHATELMAIYMYNKTFNVYKYGYGSAVSLIIFIISLSLILITQKFMKKKQY